MGCSLMPRYHDTGKANRRLLTPKFVFEYRLQQLNQKSKPTEVDQRGKKLPRKPQEESQPEASRSGPSPSTSLMPLPRITLENGSSNGDPPVPEHGSAKSSHDSPPALFSAVGEAPLAPVQATPRTEVPPIRHRRQPSPSALSQSSDDSRGLIARVAALEEWVDCFEEWRKECARWKKEVDCKFGDISL